MADDAGGCWRMRGTDISVQIFQDSFCILQLGAGWTAGPLKKRSCGHGRPSFAAHSSHSPLLSSTLDTPGTCAWQGTLKRWSDSSLSGST